MPNIIQLSERIDSLKRRAADTDCKLPLYDSKKFLEEYVRILEKLEDHVEHTRTKFNIV